MSRFRCFSLVWLLALSVIGVAANANAQFKGGAFEPPRPAPDFVLKSSSGTDFRLSQHKGKIVTLGFGYTFCPDVCPTTLADLALVRKKLGQTGRDLQVVYITVDPERDTVARLRTYLEAFDKTFIGATGTPEQLSQIQKQYGVSTKRQTFENSKAAYLVHHSAAVYLIDRSGDLRVAWPFGTTVDAMVDDVKLLAQAQHSQAAKIRIDDAWSRKASMADGQGNGAVYFTVINAASGADRLLRATSDAAASVEIHESYQRFGMMMMRPVANIEIPADGKLELKPGGYHIMLLGLKRDLKAGETVALRLTFEKAGQIPVTASVK